MVHEAFDDVEELEVEVFRASFEAGCYRALDGYAGVRGVRKARVHGSIEPEFARCLEQCMMSKRGENVGKWEKLGFATLEPVEMDTVVR